MGSHTGSSASRVQPAIVNVRRGLCLVTSVLILAGCGPETPSSGAGHGPNVCLVTSSLGLDDHGFNHMAAQGAQSAGAHLQVIASHAPSDYLTNLQRCAATHPDLVIAVS